MISIHKIGFICLVLITMAFSKEKKKSPEILASQLNTYVSFLASDQLQGRLTGSPGDSLAAEYTQHTD